MAKSGLADTGYVDFQKAAKGTLIAWLKGRNKVGVNNQFLEWREVTSEVQWLFVLGLVLLNIFINMAHIRYENGGEEV